MSVITSQLSASGAAPWVFIRACSDQALSPPFALRMGKAALTPLFEIVLDSGHDYLIAARLQVDRRTSFLKQKAELQDANGQVLAAKEGASGCFCWDALLPSQLRLLRLGLAEKLPPVLSGKDRLALVKALALPNVELLWLKDGRLYFEFIHPLFDAASLGKAFLLFQDAAGQGIEVGLRFAQGCVHALSLQPCAALPAKARGAMLNAEPWGVIPLVLNKPRRLMDNSHPWPDFSPPAPAKTRSAVLRLEGAKLQGYCFDEDQPYQAVSLDAYLDGRYQTRLLADQPGVYVQGKPLNCGWSWELDAACLAGSAHEIDLLRSDTQQRLAGCPYRLGAGVCDAEFQLPDGQALTGWIKARGQQEQPPTVVVWLDGEVVPGVVNLQKSPSDGPLPVWRLVFSLPPTLNDGANHQVMVRLMQGERCLTQTALDYQAQYVGMLDRIDQRVVSGWIYLKQAPLRPVHLEVLVNGQVAAQGLARHWPKDAVKLSPESNPLPCAFVFPLEPPTFSETRREISLRIAGTQKEVLGPPVLFTPYDIAISALIQAQTALRQADAVALANGIQAHAGATHWVRSQLIAPLIQSLRTAKRFPGRIQLELSESVRLPRQPPLEPVVDIIVPVYQGLQETLTCIRSVLDHTTRDFELIVINDGSPNPALAKTLHAWAAAGAFTLLENPQNLGFVATVNHGMRQHPQRDVVLLNADTVVTAGWLKRLRTAALSSANIATVTPFSNNATLLSFPKPCVENPMPDAPALARWAELCAEMNAGVVADIPTAVGFCMYIKRQVLDEIGDFDESRFGRGYAEENDFCLRASASGWRHVAACDVFVGHHGAKSFRDEKRALISRNLQLLQASYPDYMATIERFIVQDPLRHARNSLSKALLKAHAPNYLLFITHDLGGGVKTHTDDLAQRLLADGVAVLLLSANLQGVWKLTAHGQPHVLRYQGEEAFDRVLADLRELRVWHVHYHQALYFPQAIWTLPRQLGVAYDMTLHDYHAVCPNINMIDESGQYCGNSQLDGANCNRCLRLNPLDEVNPGLGLEKQFQALNGDVAAWRGFYGDKLQAARRVFSPSHSTAEIFLRHFPLDNLIVRPHPEQCITVTHKPFVLKPPYRIAVIGAIGPHKGYSILLNCAKSALKNGLPLEFVVFGYTQDDLALDALENVHLNGAYTPDELPEKLALSGCRIALFLSVWPETFAYTLSESWRMGLYPVAFDLGAMAERINCVGYGSLMPLTQDAKRINQALMNIAEALHQGKTADFQLGQEYPGILNSYYGLGKPAALEGDTTPDAGGRRYAVA